jgi:hypothetical protein
MAPSQSPLSAAIQTKLIDSLLTGVLWIAGFWFVEGRAYRDDVVHEHGREYPLSAIDIQKQPYERWPLSQGHVTDTGIFVVARDADVMASRTVCNRLSSENRRVLSTLYSATLMPTPGAPVCS